MRTVFACLLVAGCAAQPRPQYQWLHDSGAADRAQLNRDSGACEAQALSTHPGLPVDRGIGVFVACMRGKGWRLVER